MDRGGWCASKSTYLLFGCLVAHQGQPDVVDYHDDVDEGEEEEEIAAGEIKTGRWTPAEHAAFLRGMALHGREWKKVARTIQSRSSAQIRSHAQKHFAKSSKDDECLVMQDSPTPHHLGRALAETLAALMERRRTLLHQEGERRSSSYLHGSQTGDGIDVSRAYGAGDGSESDEMSDQELEAIRALKYLRSADKSSHTGTKQNTNNARAAAEARPVQHLTSAPSLPSPSPLIVAGLQKRRLIGESEGIQKKQRLEDST